MKKRILSMFLAISIAVGLLPMTTFVTKAVDPVSAMTVTLAGQSKKDVSVSAADPIKTIVLENGVAAVKTGVVDGWVVKMDYNAGGIPTMTLKNASATEITARTNNTAGLNIALEGENTLASATGISANGRNLTFSGSGTLNITNTGTGIGSGAETVTIDGAIVNVSTGWFGINASNLVMERGSLYVTTSRADKYAITVSGSITVKGGVVEAYSAKGAMNVAPDMSESYGFTAIGGTSSTDTADYVAANATTYKYIKVETAAPVSYMTVTLSGSGKKDIPVSETTPIKTVALVDGVATVYTGEVDGWVVKMDYNSGVPTMTLKNASVTEITARPDNNMPLNIALEGTSTLTSATGISANGRNLTFSGTGTLNITNTGTGIGSGAETVTINGATVNVSTGWFGINTSNLVMERGSLYVTTSRADKYAITVSGSIIIKRGTVEAYSAKGAMSVAPDLSQSGICTAIGGTSSTDTAEYVAANATSYKYIRIQAVDPVSAMTVTLAGNSKKDIPVSAADPVKTIVLENGVAAVKTGEVDGWVVKMDYNAGVPIMTLKNASATEITARTNNTATLNIALEGENTLASATGLSANGCDIIISGTGTLNVTNTGTGIGSGAETVTIDGAIVNVSTGWFGINARNLVMECGSLYVTTSRADKYAITVSGSITVKGGVVEAYSAKGAVSVVPDLSQYSNCTAIAGTSSEAAGAYNAASATTYKYIKVYEHTHTEATRTELSVSDCTVGGTQNIITYCADCGVVLNTVQEAVSAGEHTYTNNMDYDCDVCGTVRTVWTSYMIVSISASKKHLDVTPATPVKTIVMENGVATVKIGEADGWIVKADLNNGGIPTLTLRNANDITAIEAWSTNTAPVNIVLEGVNTITTTNNPLNANGSAITFSGTGTLNVTPTAGTGIGTGSETVTIAGATVNVSTAWFGMTVNNLVVESGSLNVTTSRDDKAAISASGSITIKGGTVEVYSAKNAMSVAPNLTQYSSYTAVGGVSSVYISAYDPASATLYKYIKIEPGSGSGSEEEIDDGIKPFYAVAWDYIDETLTPNVNECVFIGITVANGNVSFSMDGVGTDLDAIAAQMKMEMESRPEGARYLCIPGIDQVLSMAPEAIIYLDTGVDKLKEEFTSLINKYYALGGKLDGIVVDLEYLPMGSWYVYAQGYGGTGNNTNIYNDIVNHSKYQTEVRPLLEERGFQFFTEVGGIKSEIWSIAYKQAETNAVNQCIWDVVMRIRLSQYMNEAIFTPLIARYPNAIMSDYQATDTYGWLKDLHDDGGRKVYQGGNSMKTGNASNYNFYGSRPGNNYYVNESTGLPVYNTPPSYLNAVYKRDPYNMLLWDMMKAKNMVKASDGGHVNFWVGTYDVYYGGYVAGTYANTPYYSELLLHFGLLNPQPFLLYLSKGEYKVDGVVDVEKYNDAVMVVSEILDELTRRVGAANRQTIDFPVSWNDGYLLTGMSAGGKNVWRITPDTAYTSLQDFRVADAAVPTFTVNGKTVTFPQGTVIETATISQVGSCGYWVETPANVVPVVKSVADRFEQYPAYSENYEGFEAGTAYTSETALPAATWTVTGTATVQAQGENQVLSVNGNFSLTNTQLPQNITAGDSYAKHQAWQVTVTVPVNMDAAAALNLLTANGDSGVKIAGGKAYYTVSGVDTELATLSAGTYVIKRELDFSNANAFTSDYYVYSASGALLGSATDIAMTAISLPVTAIGMTGTNMGTASVQLDNYKLYITGFEGDFELYDAEGGVIVANATVARDADTAYRYSWVNASDKVKNATIVATYYDANNNQLSQEVVKTLRMVPGNDGVETGIVELGDKGATVLVTLVFSADTDPAADDFA